MIIPHYHWTAEEIIAHYVFYGTIIVTAVAVVERIIQTYEEWLKQFFPDSKWVGRSQKADYIIGAINDLLNRFLALNFRDLIVKRNGKLQRATDKPNVTVVTVTEPPGGTKDV